MTFEQIVKIYIHVDKILFNKYNAGFFDTSNVISRHYSQCGTPSPCKTLKTRYCNHEPNRYT